MKLIYKFVIVSFILAIAHETIAQDKVHLRNGTVYDGRVTAIDSTTIILYMGEKEPALLFQISLIKAIVYSDGSVETFEDHLRNLKNKSLLHPTTTVKFLSTSVLYSLLGGIAPVQGLGQFYNGENMKGFGFFGLGLTGVTALVYAGKKTGRQDARVYGSIVYLGSWIFSVYDAYMFSKANERQQISISPSLKGKDPVIELAIRF